MGEIKQRVNASLVGWLDASRVGSFTVTFGSISHATRTHWIVCRSPEVAMRWALTYDANSDYHDIRVERGPDIIVPHDIKHWNDKERLVLPWAM